jgi:hypothetical protein
VEARYWRRVEQEAAAAEPPRRGVSRAPLPAGVRPLTRDALRAHADRLGQGPQAALPPHCRRDYFAPAPAPSPTEAESAAAAAAAAADAASVPVSSIGLHGEADEGTDPDPPAAWAARSPRRNPLLPRAPPPPPPPPPPPRSPSLGPDDPAASRLF